MHGLNWIFCLLGRATEWRAHGLRGPADRGLPRVCHRFCGRGRGLSQPAGTRLDRYFVTRPPSGHALICAGVPISLWVRLRRHINATHTSDVNAGRYGPDTNSCVESSEGARGRSGLQNCSSRPGQRRQMCAQRRRRRLRNENIVGAVSALTHRLRFFFTTHARTKCMRTARTCAHERCAFNPLIKDERASRGARARRP